MYLIRSLAWVAALAVAMSLNPRALAQTAPETPPPAAPEDAPGNAPAEGAAEGEAGTDATQPEAPAEPSVYATPEACFEAAKSAFNKRDWRSFVDCVSPPRRDVLIGQMAATFAMMAQQPDADERVTALVKRHLPPDFDPMQVFTEQEEDVNQMKEIVRKIRDKRVFFVEAMSLAFEMEYPDPETAATITELTDVATDEEALTATGVVHLKAGDKVTQDQWDFEKHEDAWYLTMK